MTRSLFILGMTAVACLGRPVFRTGAAPSGTNWITIPSQLQVFQRSGNTGTIPIAGTTTGAHVIEASFNGGAFATIVTNPVGYFTASLSGQGKGWGTLTVRWADQTNHYTQITCGIGDVFVVAGQSNASGRGSNNQSYSAGGFAASEFDNAYAWQNLTDPTDDATGQADTVSADTGGTAAAGSIWPLLATTIITNQTCPVAFIPCAKGSSTISDWQPAASHYDRATLYGSMAFRAIYAIQGGVRAVLMWEGETDALAGVSQATYYTALTNFTAGVQADLGVKVMCCKLQNCSGISAPNQAAINAAIGQAWSDDTNSLTGPDLSGIDTAPDDTLHLKTDAKLGAAAALWFSALYP